MSKITRDTILDKLENIGTPLGQHWAIHQGINTGYNKAFVIDEGKHQQLIAEDSNSEKLIKLAIGKPQKNRWKPDLKYLIWIPSSEFKTWCWSGKSAGDAEQIFEAKYPAIHNHLHNYRDKLKNRHTNSKGKFYWELSECEECPKFHGPKIIFYKHPSMPLAAYYDQSSAYILNNKVFCVPTADFSLLAILNSKLFEWYVQARFKKVGKLYINKRNMEEAAIAGTEKQKLEISHLVQQILDVPNGPNVPNLEEEINMLIYDIYDLTSAEIALIEKGHNP